jgi:membrane-bound metal-dependent hydrolase YbcI (DUF457 family)
MPNFKTHITVSTALGAAYGGAGFAYLDLPPPACLLSAGLFSIGGILPDVDSDSGIPLRETTAFAAAVVPMMLVKRFQEIGLEGESLPLACIGTYLLIRFGLAAVLRRTTVHRGMWHSLPGAAIAGLLTLLICSCDAPVAHLFKAGAVAMGYASHLLLDEFNSLGLWSGRLGPKASAGTAVKLFGRSYGANLCAYGILLLLLAAAWNDPWLRRHYAEPLRPSISRQQSLPLLPDGHGSIWP